MARAPWFRFYSEVLHDPKIQRLPIALRWSWVNVLCLANEQEPRGQLPQLKDVAYSLRVSEAKARAMLSSLKDAGLLDADGAGRLWPHNWSARQYASDLRETPGRKAADETRRLEGGVWVKPPPNRGETAANSRRNRGETTATEQSRAETETEQRQRDPPKPPLPSRAAAVAFEQGFGRLLSPTEFELIKALEEEHPPERIEYALREAAALNKRSVRYVQRTCERIANEGGELVTANGARKKSLRYDE